jgi:hypothetical protein
MAKETPDHVISTTWELLRKFPGIEMVEKV